MDTLSSPPPNPFNQPRDKTEGALARVLRVLKKEYIIVGRSRVNVFRSWLAIGLVAGIAVGIVFVANRSGELEPSVAGPVKKEEREKEKNFVAGEIVIKFKEGVEEKDQEKLLKEWGLSKKGEIKQIKTKIISVPEDAEEHLVEALSHNPHVEFAEVNGIFESEVVPNDTGYPDQWHLPKIGAPTAWDITTGSNSITIAILDSGVDGSHPDLAAKMVAGYNFWSNNTDTSDVFGHGTQVAGAATAIGNNIAGVASPAWQNKIMPVRVSDAGGWATSQTISSGLTWAVDQGARVMNLSFNGIAGSITIRTAAQYVVDRGGIVVAAAGNCGCTDSTADNPFIVSASATDQNDVLASFSSRGLYIDISAPGVSILTTVRGGGYNAPSGTSFASPIVAGVAALLLSANPSLTPAQVETILETTATDLGDAGLDQSFGHGRVNAAAALGADEPVVPPPPPVDSTPPTTSVTSPTSGATVSGTVIVTATASDNVGVTKVELRRDGLLIGIDTAAPYTFAWNTTADTNGSHTLQTRAYDTAGGTGQSSNVTVTISNTTDTTLPVVSISDSTGNTMPSKGTYAISATATDNIGVTRIDILMDGILRGTCSYSPTVTSGSCTANINVRKVSSGSHTITVNAYDAKGNKGINSLAVTKP